MFAGEAGVIDDVALKALDGDGAELGKLGGEVGRVEDAGKGDEQHGAGGRGLDEAGFGAEGEDAGGFGADEGAGDVEAVFGEEVVEVEAGDAAGIWGKPERMSSA